VQVPKVLTDDELRRLLEQPNLKVSSGRRNKAMLMVMAYCGLRVGEVVDLRMSDLRRNEAARVVELHLRHTKGKRPRLVPVPPHVGDALQYWLNTKADMGITCERVFCTISRGTLRHPKPSDQGFDGAETVETELKRGEPVSANYVRQMVKRLADERHAGIGDWVHPHTLRHTAATRLLRESKNLEAVRKFLGHSDLSTTQVYLEVADTEVAEAVNGVSDVEARPEDEADTLAAQVLAALPPEVREALAKRLRG